MKTLRLALAAAVVLAPAWNSSAQSPPVVRGDVAGTLGVQAVDAGGDDYYRRHRLDGGFFGGISGGWYWTENLKSEIEFGARRQGSVWMSGPVMLDGAQSYYATDRTFSRRTLALGQQYQFFHNAWFHPHLGAGASLSFERSTLHRAATSVYDPITRTGRIITPERTDPAQTDFRVSPYVDTGFKAYMTPRAFFRSDLRVAFRGGVDDVVTRFGFGFDF